MVTNVTTTNKEGKVQSFIKNNPCVIIHQCTKFGDKRTQHREVTSINNNYKFLLPEAVCCCLQTCNVYIIKSSMGYTSILSFSILCSCIYGLHHNNCLYHNVWPRANSCHFLKN